MIFFTTGIVPKLTFALLNSNDRTCWLNKYKTASCRIV